MYRGTVATQGTAKVSRDIGEPVISGSELVAWGRRRGLIAKDERSQDLTATDWRVLLMAFVAFTGRPGLVREARPGGAE